MVRPAVTLDIEEKKIPICIAALLWLLEKPKTVDTNCLPDSLET